MPVFHIHGKQILDATIDENKLAASVAGAGLAGGAGSALDVGAGTGIDVQANTVGLLDSTGTVTYSGTHVSTHTKQTLQLTGTLTGPNDPVSKSDLDAAITGITWVNPVKVLGFIGERTIAQIDALTPTAGDSVVATDAGTPAAGASDALAAGDLAEFDGTDWKLLYANAAGRLPNNLRLVVSTTATLFSPLTAATDEGKILVSVSDPGALNGSVSDFNDTGDAVDGNAVLVQCPPGNTAVSVNENNGYVFDGAVGATANWIQFTGAGTLNAGAGLLLSGSTLDVQAADNSMTINADDIQVNVGDGLVVGTALDVDPYSGGDASVAPAFVDGDGVGVDTDGSTITHTAGVLGVPAGGIGATELDETDTYDFSPSGSVAVATAAPSTNTTQAASTAFVQQEIGSFQNVVFGCIRLAIVVAASNTNVNIASAPATIDGVTIGAGAKVLLLNQTTPSENGVWESAGTGNPFTRPNKEFPTGSNQGGAYVRVIDGATFDDLTYRCTNDPGSDVVDIDNLNFSIATSLKAGNGITFGGSLGNEVTVAADATGGANLARAINVSANGVAISIDGSSVTENGSQQLAAPVPSGQGLNQAPGNSAGADDFDTGLSLAQTPANGHLPRVYLNGAYQQVARNDGERAASAWYFGAVGGTAIADGSIASTHKLFYNAAVTGVDITGSDRIDIDYVIPRP